jgi:hypothetical protein
MKVKTFDLRDFFDYGKSAANHHAPKIHKIIPTLLGQVMWKQDRGVPFEVWQSQCGRTRSRIWMKINGRTYMFGYNQQEGKMFLRIDGHQGNVIAKFDNDTPLEYIESVFEKLKPTPTFGM